MRGLLPLWLALGVLAAAAALLVSSWGDSEGSRATLADPLATYDPTEAGEQLPDSYRRVLERDRFLPVYEPQFTTPDLVEWPDDMLVIGVTDGEVSKAYSVTYLNQREMVIDEIGGTPILVSW